MGEAKLYYLIEGNQTITMSDVDTSRGEQVMLVVMIAIAVVFLQGSLSMSRITGSFPMLTSVLTIVLGTTLLVRDYLPEGVKNVITAESVDRSSFEPDIEGGKDGDVDESSEQLDAHSVDSKDGKKTFALTYALVGTFMVFSYLFGMLAVTPVFIAVYGLWVDLSWKEIAPTILTGFLFLYALAEYLHIPLDEGVIEIVLSQTVFVVEFLEVLVL